MILDIPYSSLPHQSALFLKYIEGDPGAARFYPQSPTIKNLEYMAKEGLAAAQFPRKEIASILRSQNECFGADASVMHHIDELEKPDSVAIVTGQQVGLFTGPVYTIYKALTAVKIAEELRKRGVRAIPVFWLETEDHDLQEASQRTVLDSPASAQVIDFSKNLFPGSGLSMHSVGSIPLPQQISSAISAYFQFLPDSPEKRGLRTLVETAYAPEATYALAFARLLRQVLQGYGLVCFDPGEKRVKQLTAPIFQRALQHAEELRSSLLQRNRELQTAGLHTQVQVLENSTVVFYYLNGERRLLEQHESGFRIKNSDLTFTREELPALALQAPELFSPSVLLRPIIQDHLFPTIAYIGGAAEIAYFAQIETLYAQFQRPMPVIWPRNGFTLIEPSVSEAMKHSHIEFHDCFLERQDILEKVLRNSGDYRAAGKLDDLHTHLEQELAKLRPALATLEKGMALMLDKSQEKILHNIRYLKSRVLRLETSSHDSIARSVDLAINHCRPNGNLQERELTVLHFLAVFGMPLIKALYAATETVAFTHRVLWLKKNGESV